MLPAFHDNVHVESMPDENVWKQTKHSAWTDRWEDKEDNDVSNEEIAAAVSEQDVEQTSQDTTETTIPTPTDVAGETIEEDAEVVEADDEGDEVVTPS